MAQRQSYLTYTHIGQNVPGFFGEVWNYAHAFKGQKNLVFRGPPGEVQKNLSWLALARSPMQPGIKQFGTDGKSKENDRLFYSRIFYL